MRKVISADGLRKGVAIFGAVVALPVIVLRSVVHLPATLVDAMERFGVEK